MNYSTFFASIVVLFFCNAATAPVDISNSGTGECEISASQEIPWFIKNKKSLHVPPPINIDFVPRAVKTHFIEQKLDHFDPLNNSTWNMRYMSNGQFYKPGGPIFIMIGGEWTIDFGYLASGQMFNIARQNHGYMFYTEHRYYGSSWPTNDLSVENLRHLTADQALEDLANFIQQKRNEINATKVIVFGGSYAGNLAAWVRIKYPHLVQGAVVSSAPLEAKADFKEYFEIVTDALASASQLCVDNIRTATKEIEELLLSDEGAQDLGILFLMCGGRINRHDSATVSNFVLAIAERFAGKVASSKEPGDLEELCKPMLNKRSSPLENLSGYVPQARCNDFSYENLISRYRETGWCSPAAREGLRQWTYQTCTEFGYFQTSTSTKQPFGTKFPLNYYLKMCADIFGVELSSQIVNQGVETTNFDFGGRTPDLTNAVFIQGSVDPWHALGVLKDLSDKTPAFYVEGTSHCADLNRTTNSEMVVVQQITQFLVERWLK